MKKPILAVICLMMLISISGCETFKGLAQDVENTGRNIKDFLTGNN